MFVKEYSDKEIAECLRKRQNYAVVFLYSSCFPLIRYMVMKAGGSVDNAREIFQECLIILIKKLDDSNFILTCQLKTYLYSICSNMWKSQIEKKNSQIRYLERKLDDDEIKDFSEQQDYILREEVFYGAFKTLNPLHQKILSLYWKDYSLKEIAESLGLTQGYVKKEKCVGQAELVMRVKGHRDYDMLRE
jgi:RNA polymerase sigma factor (sigma-70 family)